MNRTTRNRIGQKCFLAFCVAAWSLGIQCMAGPMEDVLERAGRSVKLFWQQVPSFTCKEAVSQQKISGKGKIEYKQESVFDYLALTNEESDDLTVEELRLPQKKAVDKSNKPSLLSTNGFATFLLIFHPLYQANYRYHIEPESSEGDTLLRVGFEHIPGMRSTSALLLREKVYPLDLQGMAWIDKGTGAIQKITANLVAPLKDLNIKAFDVEVIYKPQHFSSEAEVRWLPSSAVIDVQTALQHWRNIHLFSQYKRFTVQSIETTQPSE